jgi:hypothetical protein
MAAGLTAAAMAGAFLHALAGHLRPLAATLRIGE